MEKTINTPEDNQAQKQPNEFAGMTTDEIYHEESEKDAFDRFLAAQDMYLMMKQEGLI